MNKNSNQSGFTLLELSIVLIISGLMVVAAIEAYEVYNEKRKIDQINTQMADLDQYIKNFPTMIDPATVDPVTGIGTPYGRFPCPAPMDGTGVGNDFDTEDCSITPIAGVQPDGSNGGAPVLIGKIPAATLGLNSDYMRDPYGNYLLYAVTQGASNSATYGTTSGSIQVIEEGIDRNPASATRGQIVELERHNNVQYMVVSMGDTDAGAYAFNGTQPTACPANTVKEHENCDGDASFITSLLHEGNINDFYDDKVLFAANTVVVPNNEEPAGCEQQESFTTYADSCPDGWEEQVDIPDFEVPHFNGHPWSVTNYDDFGNLAGSPIADEPSYYNIDPDTGDYYFTNFETAQTELATPNSGTKRVCTKQNTNPQNTKCHTETVDIQTGVGVQTAHSGLSSDRVLEDLKNQIEEYCPDGWRPVSIQTNGYVIRYVDNRDERQSTPSYAIQCGR